MKLLAFGLMLVVVGLVINAVRDFTIHKENSDHVKEDGF